MYSGYAACGIFEGVAEDAVFFFLRFLVFFKRKKTSTPGLPKAQRVNIIVCVYSDIYLWDSRRELRSSCLCPQINI